MSSLVAFTGAKGSGKDSSAAPLIEVGWASLAFADPLKAILADWNPYLGDGGETLLWDVVDERRLGTAIASHLPALRGAVSTDAVRRVLAAVAPRAGGDRLNVHLDSFGGDVEAFKRSGSAAAREFRRLMQYLGTEGIRGEFGNETFADDLASRTRALLEQDRCVVVTDVRFDVEAEIIRGLGGSIIEVLRPGLIKDDGHASEAGISPELVDAIVSNNGSLELLRSRVLGLLSPVPS